MTCLSCGDDTLVREYTLLCTPDEGDPRECDLFLCTDCLAMLRAEPDIELVADPVVPSPD